MTSARALVLAAGASRRLGRPKALLDFDGRTALEVLLDALREAGLTSGAVVTGASGQRLREAVDAGAMEWVENPDPEAGRTGSLQAGLRALAGDVDVLLWPVDRPLGSADTVRALLDAAEHAPRSGVVLPEHAGRAGHPLLLRGGLRAALTGAPPGAILRDVLREHGDGTVRVPVDDPGIHFDLDTEDAYRRALEWWRKRS